MANFTPQEIEEILQQFFDVVGKRQYVGARYVPIFGRKGESSIEWDNSKPYEPLTIVIYQGNSYTSRTYVPVGVTIDDSDFWALTGNYNAQIESYRRDTVAVQEQIDATDAIIPKSSFSTENTVKKYIDDTTYKLNKLACVDYYGADHTGTSDSSAAIAACIAANHGGTIWFNSGSYKISEPIKTPHGRYYDRVSIDFNGATVEPTQTMDCMLDIGAIGTVFGHAGESRTFYKNGIFVNTFNESADISGIRISHNYKDTVIDSMNILYFKIGIEQPVSDPCDAEYINCYLRYNNMSVENSIGIKCNSSSDSKLDCCRIYGFMYAIHSSGGTFPILNNLHVLPKIDSFTLEKMEKCAMLYSGSNGSVSVVASSVYCDTYSNFLLAPNATTLYCSITNSILYCYDTGLQLQPVLFNVPNLDYAYGQCSFNMISNSTGYPVYLFSRDYTSFININKMNVEVARFVWNTSLLTVASYFSNYADSILTTNRKESLCWPHGKTPADVGTRWYLAGIIPLITEYNTVDLTITFPFSTPRWFKWCLVLSVSSNSVSMYGHDTGFAVAGGESSLESTPLGFNIYTDRCATPMLCIYQQLPENTNKSSIVIDTNYPVISHIGYVSFSNAIQPSDFSPTYTLTLRS